MEGGVNTRSMGSHTPPHNGSFSFGIHSFSQSSFLSYSCLIVKTCLWMVEGVLAMRLPITVLSFFTEAAICDSLYCPVQKNTKRRPPTPQKHNKARKAKTLYMIGRCSERQTEGGMEECLHKKKIPSFFFIQKKKKNTFFSLSRFLLRPSVLGGQQTRITTKKNAIFFSFFLG